ncbi:MAG: hypothetical protein UW92_C0014G0017, partial [Candidatus Jorgensenbacteria bacterium GW2011_GWA2_45_13]
MNPILEAVERARGAEGLLARCLYSGLSR